MSLTAEFASPARRFRLAAIAEAISRAGLLIGMLFKYVVVRDPIGVQIFGPIHGAIFLIYLVAAVATAVSLRRSRPMLIWALIASIPPFGSIVFERVAVRRRELAELSSP